MMSHTPTDVKPALYVQCIDDNIKLPCRKSKDAAGYDLHAHIKDRVIIKIGTRKAIATGLKIRVPEGCYGRIAPRSGLALDSGIDIAAGVIDRDYRGEVKVILINNGDKPFIINDDDRIAQLICEKIISPEIIKVDGLDDTERGADGFGSTGFN